MFRAMRRKAQQLPHDEAERILAQGEYGVISTVGEDGYPYGVAVNYIYKDGAIYFHCANSGHKLDNITYNNKVSFLVVSNPEVVAERFDTRYKSVVVFGRVSVVPDDEKKDIVIAIGDRFCSGYAQKGRELADRQFERFTIVKIETEHITGKGNL